MSIDGVGACACDSTSRGLWVGRRARWKAGDHIRGVSPTTVNQLFLGRPWETSKARRQVAFVVPFWVGGCPRKSPRFVVCSPAKIGQTYSALGGGNDGRQHPTRQHEVAECIRMQTIHVDMLTAAAQREILRTFEGVRENAVMEYVQASWREFLRGNKIS